MHTYSSPGWDDCTILAVYTAVQQRSIIRRTLAVCAQILYTLAALDVPAALHGGPKTASELAGIVGAFHSEDGSRLPLLARWRLAHHRA